MNPYIDIAHLYKYFGSFTALDDINIAFPQGELVCFLGPSGCGKTTLLRAIAGLDRHSAGQIFIGGEDVSDYPPAQRDFGIVFQNYALFPNLKVKDNIAYGMAQKGYKRKAQKARVKELLDLVGLPDQGDKYPNALSGGQQQRVALARALAVSPKILLLDEPLSALDAKVRAHLRKEIKSLQRELGVTTIMVTHDQEEALAMADRIVILRDGKVEQIGTPQDIYQSPANAFVAQFIGEMNFLAAERVADHTLRVGQRTFTFDGHRFAGQQRDVVMAIRPEDVWVQKRDAHDDNTLHATMIMQEYLGATCRSVFSGGDIPDERILADIGGHALRQQALQVGTELPLTLPPEQILLFDRA